MTEYQERALVWQKIEGSEKLHEIYGYYPTFHDASVIKVDCDFDKNEVSVTFYYSDMVGKDVDNIATTLITLCWQNLVEANFSLHSNYIYHTELKFDGEKFEAIFSGTDFEGQLLSKNIKVSKVIVEPDTSEWTNTTFHTTRFSMK